MAGWRLGRAAAVSCWLVLCALSALADGPAPALPASAFVTPQPCRVEPYADTSLEQREQSLERQCGWDRLQFKLDGPRTQGTGLVSAPVKLEADQLLTRNDGALTSSVRLGWAAQRDEKEGRLQTERALFAAGSMLKLSPDLALDMSVGRDVGANLPTRTTVTGLWRTGSDQLLFAEFAPDASGVVASAIGLRWWLVPNRLVLDVAARRSADGQAIEPRVGLSVLEFGR
jgi:hypothetical protein